MFELNPNEIQIEVNKLGYDIFPKRQENGKFLMEVWLGDEKCFGLGKVEYSCWREGSNKTYKDFYKKLILGKVKI